MAPATRGVRTIARTYSTKSPVKYLTGTEGLESVIVNPNLGFTADADGRIIVPAGALLAKVTTAGVTLGHFGKYDSTATDGRQTLLAGATEVGVHAVILSDELDVTDGPWDLGGYYDGTHFHYVNLMVYGATLAQLRAAFPTCFFL